MIPCPEPVQSSSHPSVVTLSASDLFSDFHTQFYTHFWFSHKSCMSGLLSKLAAAVTHLTSIWEMPCSHCILRFFMNFFDFSRQVPGLYLYSKP